MVPLPILKISFGKVQRYSCVRLYQTSINTAMLQERSVRSGYFGPISLEDSFSPFFFSSFFSASDLA